MNSFLDEWNALIHYFMLGGSVVIKVNDDMAPIFRQEKVSDKTTHYHPCYSI
jgi:hypothetical protein